MRTAHPSLALLLSILLAACGSGGDASPEPEPVEEASCVDRCGGTAPAGCACAPGCEEAGTCCDDYAAACERVSCEDPTLPEGCPEARVTPTIDLVTGCPILVCAPCPQVDVPRCDERERLVPETDPETGCPRSWRCVACGDEPAVPACPGGYPVATKDESGCIQSWRCESCPTVAPPSCDEPEAVTDPQTGCVQAWECPDCPEPVKPTCGEGWPVMGQNPATGCPEWLCPLCPERPACERGEAVGEIDPRTGCTVWSCPGCPEEEPPDCDGGWVSEGTDELGCPAFTCEPCPDAAIPVCEEGRLVERADEHGCPFWECVVCDPIEPPACEDATAIEDALSGCIIRWDCPDDRWGSFEGLYGDALKRALREAISGHTNLGYTRAREQLFGFVSVDDDGMVECVYTGRKLPGDFDTVLEGSDYDFNTEHTWPQSKGAKSEPARADLHHLFPTESRANSARGSYPFGNTSCVASGCPWYDGGSERGTRANGGGTVFEVRPQNRGDTARAMFYFSVRYNLRIDAAEEEDLRRWHQEDPPSDWERLRNDRVESLQHNRNPFVDRPDFVARIADF